MGTRRAAKEAAIIEMAKRKTASGETTIERGVAFLQGLLRKSLKRKRGRDPEAKITANETKISANAGGALKKRVSDRMTPEMTPEELERAIATSMAYVTMDTKKKGAKRKVGKKVVVEEVDGITLKEPAKRKVGKKVKVKKGDGITLKEPAKVVIDAKRTERTGILSGLDAIRANAKWRI